MSLCFFLFFFFNDTATTEIYTYDTLFPYTTLFRSPFEYPLVRQRDTVPCAETSPIHEFYRSEEHTSELQSLMRISYAVFCLKKKKSLREVQNVRPKDQRNQTYATQLH